MSDQFYLARKMLQMHEGIRLEAYDDTTGHQTIGYGWNLDAKPLPVGVGKMVDGRLTITTSEAEALLDMSMLDHWNELAGAFRWVNNLSEWRKAVLLDMAFNMGIPTLKTFKNTLSLISAGDYDGASRLMLQSQWAKQVKRRADVLSEIMRIGTMTQSQKVKYGIGIWEHY
jgi:lysozyme